MFKSGYLPTEDNADYLNFSDHKSGFIKTGSFSDELILPEYSPISNQRQTSTCVGNSSCDALELLLGAEGLEVEQLSRLFAYWNSRLLHKATDKDNGTFINLCFEGFKKYGCCSEESWPFEETNLFKQPNVFCYKEADDNKITEAYRLTSKDDDLIDDIKAALEFKSPIVFGAPVGNDFVNDKFNVVAPLAFPTVSVGNHAMVIVGYKKVNNEYWFRVRNSWGTKWGDNGYCWFSSQYISKCYDLWVPVRINSFHKE